MHIDPKTYKYYYMHNRKENYEYQHHTSIKNQKRIYA